MSTPKQTRVVHLLRRHPDKTMAQIARDVRVSISYVRRLNADMGIRSTQSPSQHPSRSQHLLMARQDLVQCLSVYTCRQERREVLQAYQDAATVLLAESDDRKAAS